MSSILNRIERLERNLSDVAPVNPHFVKRKRTEQETAEFMAEVERIISELTADARARDPNYDEELAKLWEGVEVVYEDGMG